MLDPFGGIGLGAADAVREKINWVGVELEQRFVDFGGCECTGISKADWVRCYGRWKKFNYTEGRYWCPACLDQAAKADKAEVAPSHSSLFDLSNYKRPTAAYQQDSGRIPSTAPHYYKGAIDRFNETAQGGARAVLWQGDSRELVAVLREKEGGQSDGVISSPPWGDVEGSKAARKFGDPERSAELQQDSHRPGTTKGAILYNMEKADDYTYGNEDGNLGNLAAREMDFQAVVGSPPFAGNSGGRGEASRNGIEEGLFDRHQGAMVGGIGDKGGGNLASMQAKEGDLQAVITSPPYVESLGSDDPQKRGGLFRDPKRGGDKTLTATYGQTDGQLGGMKIKDDTFWAAARLIVEQCRAVLAEGSPAVFVTKDFVKNWQRLPFSMQWVQLCEACGFALVVHIRAWLVEERGAQYDLDGDLIVKKVEHKTFFRRVAEKKGSPRIDWEDVLVFKAR